MQPIIISTTRGASAAIYPYGAHLTSWKTARGKQWLYLSSQAVFKEGKSIRGGVPVIFPQFNERGSGPRHGFARTSFWELIEPAHSSAGSTHCAFRLRNSRETQTAWPHLFEARYQVTLADDSLELGLKIVNTDTKPFTFTAALHTYVAISALKNVALQGLGGKSFWNNDGSDFDHRRIQPANILAFTDALDRVYFDVTESLQLTDNNQSLNISQSGFNDVVVWNPGREAAKGMADMADREYQSMLCVEAAQIDKPVTLLPGAEWVGVQRLSDCTP
jgi:glucose-6-phosphate 1-epimerase